jgi:hypothetical protein
VDLRCRGVVDLCKAPRKSASKEFKNWNQFYRFIDAGKLFFGFFYRFIGAGKLFFGFFHRFIGAGKLFFGFSIASSVQENFFSVFSIASSVKKTLPFKIVSLYSIFFSKIVYQYRFNRYIFEYRCPSLDAGYALFGQNEK